MGSCRPLPSMGKVLSGRTHCRAPPVDVGTQGVRCLSLLVILSHRHLLEPFLPLLMANLIPFFFSFSSHVHSCCSSPWNSLKPVVSSSLMLWATWNCCRIPLQTKLLGHCPGTRWPCENLMNALEVALGQELSPIVARAVQ